ncbi:MAG: CRISPR-associated endonuclease Cas3'' [Gammaproteobacteria bacterium]
MRSQSPEHRVAALAKQHAARRPWEDEAALTGLLHDLGKYADRFQARLRGEDKGLDHWSQGAWRALKEHHAVAAALSIEGHHVGLQPGNHDSLRRLHPQSLANHHPFRLALSDPDLINLTQRAEADGPGTVP